MPVTLFSALWRIDECLLAVAVARLLYLGIPRRYPALFAFLLTDLATAILGSEVGIGARLYYWTWVASQILFGAVLKFLMAREMFAELYAYHRGLEDMTRRTLRASILIGAIVAVALAPVALIHRGDPDFRCWYLPVIESHRCLTIGLVVFIALMLRKLARLPLAITDNSKTYSRSIGIYFLSSGILETVVLVAHERRTTDYCATALLFSSILFHVWLTLRMRAPCDLRADNHMVAVDAHIVQRLASMASFLRRLDGATNQANDKAFRQVVHRYFGVRQAARVVRNLLGFLSSRSNRVEPTGQ